MYLVQFVPSPWAASPILLGLGTLHTWLELKANFEVNLKREKN